MSITRQYLGVIVLLGLFVGQSRAEPPGSFNPGQSVEVREGDEWSKARIVKKEGRKFLIHYDSADNAADEWVTPDRIRAASGDAPATSPAETKQPTAAVRPGFKIGDLVEIKDGLHWSNAKVVNVRGQWLLVEYERRGGWREWAEPWRLRKQGSTKDNLPFVSRNARYKNGDNPPRPAPGDAPPSGKTGEGGKEDPFSPPPTDAPITEADLSGIEELLPTPPGGAWSLVPDPVAPGPSTRAVTLRAKAVDKDLHFRELEIRDRTGIAVYSDFFGKERIKVERLDLGGGSTSLFDFSPASLPLLVSPSGKILVARSNGFHNGTKSRLDLFTLAPGQEKPQHLVSFAPYGGAEKNGSDVAWVAMLDETTLLTCNTKGRLMGWEVGAAKAKAGWALELGKGAFDWFVKGNAGAMALSPGGKYVAAVCEEGLVVADARSGQVVGAISEGPDSGTMGAFSQSGKTFIALSRGLLANWDLASGKFLREVGTIDAINSLLCPDDGFALINNSDLIDLKTGAIVWKYKLSNPQDAAMAAAGKQICYTLDNRLGAANLPHSSARAAAGKITDEVLLLKPGAAVAMDINIEADEEQKKKVDQAIRARLSDAGIKIDDAAPVKLVARTEAGKTEEVSYRKFGTPPWGETEKVNVTQKITRVYLETDGKKVWERQSVNAASPLVHIEKGQTISEAVAKTNVYNVGFLETVRIPTILPRPQDPASIGSSQLLIAGAKDIR